MKTKRKKLLTISVVSISLWLSVSIEISPAQSGGGYDLSQNVIASGGGSNSTGGPFTVDGTVGQPIAGMQISGAPFSLRGGFWSPPSFAPTAAGVAVGGRVVTSARHGIPGAHLILTDLSTGDTRTARSNSFGYFRFNEVIVGRVYSVSVQTRRYTFFPNSHVFNLADELTDIEFVASSEQ